tara:strand:+ start:525 stop:1052 length:528 start_codon:yes stop_codon:yes gene_type:complete
MILIPFNVLAEVKKKIISNLNNIENINFKFIQTIEGKDEKGNCTIAYPKKIYCKYAKFNKILVSNGNSLVIKTNKNNQYYRYKLENTPLNFLLDKKYIIEKISKFNYKIIDKKYYMFSLDEKKQNINIFFDKVSLDLIGWQTEDLYQNLSVTYIFDIKKNEKIDNKIFKLPTQIF